MSRVGSPGTRTSGVKSIVTNSVGKTVPLPERYSLKRNCGTNIPRSEHKEPLVLRPSVKTALKSDKQFKSCSQNKYLPCCPIGGSHFGYIIFKITFKVKVCKVLFEAILCTYYTLKQIQ